MPGVNFKIRGNSPPFNVELRRSSTGALVDQKSVTQSGVTQSFLNLDYNVEYYLKATDSASSYVTKNFTSIGTPTITININEYYDAHDIATPDENGGVEYEECVVCGCLEYTPNMSSGQKYDLGVCYDLKTNNLANYSSLSRVKIFNDNNEIFSESVANNEDDINGVYTISEIQNYTPITYQAYSCVRVINTTLTPREEQSSTSETCVWINNPTNEVNADFNIGTPYCTTISTKACQMPSSTPPPPPPPEDIFTIGMFYEWTEPLEDDFNDGILGYVNQMSGMLIVDTHQFSDYTKSDYNEFTGNTGTSYNIDLSYISAAVNGYSGPATICWSDDNFQTSSTSDFIENIDQNSVFEVRVKWWGMA